MSTETKWTPGPWVVSSEIDELGNETFLVHGQDRSYEAAICDLWSGEHDNKANATLIAAAPELYEALEALTGVVQSDPFLRYSEDSLYGKAIKEALAVLKKARGE